MSGMDIQSMSYTGMQVGLGVALIPVAVTSLIACSRIIFVNMIADIVVRILTANTYTMTVNRVSFVAVPLLWKVSLYAAMTGGALIALSITAALVDSTYHRYTTSH